MKFLSPDKQSIFLRASISDCCNFSCQYCASDLGMENHTPPCLNAPLLSSDEYIKNLKLIANHGFQNISFTGGEPLLNPALPEMLKESRKIFKTIEITTNGSKLKQYMEVIKENVDVLKISIDALNPELCTEITRNSVASDTPKIIEDCCKFGIKNIGLNFVYMKKNKDELPKIVDFAAELMKKYNCNIYISILDLYYSNGNKKFWEDQFINLSELRNEITQKGQILNHRIRIGCDSYNFIWNNVVVNMKDSLSCTHRAAICENCSEYCQEGIYSLKHSASGWISCCPTNNLNLGSLINQNLSDDDINNSIDKYVEILNSIRRMDNTGDVFIQKHTEGVRYE